MSYTDKHGNIWSSEEVYNVSKTERRKKHWWGGGYRTPQEEKTEELRKAYVEKKQKEMNAKETAYHPRAEMKSYISSMRKGENRRKKVNPFKLLDPLFKD